MIGSRQFFSQPLPFILQAAFSNTSSAAPMFWSGCSGRNPADGNFPASRPPRYNSNIHQLAGGGWLAPSSGPTAGAISVCEGVSGASPAGAVALPPCAGGAAVAPWGAVPAAGWAATRSVGMGWGVTEPSAAATRQTVLPASSAISNAPVPSIARPTGLPRTWSPFRNPVTTSTGLPDGFPAREGHVYDLVAVEGIPVPAAAVADERAIPKGFRQLPSRW